MRKQLGFTLLEVTFLLAILGILASLGLNYLKSSKQHENFQNNGQLLLDVKANLLSFLAVNYYLPCPSEKDDGYETRKADGSCKVSQGHLPYLELELSSNKDIYGNSILYAINDNSRFTSEKNHFRKLCSSSSLFARSGSYDNELLQCDSTELIYCSTETQCKKACGNATCSPKTLTRNRPPYSHYLTQPLGSMPTVTGAITLCNEKAQVCKSDTIYGEKAVGLVPVLLVSFGKNGKETWEHFKNCQGIVSTKEELNCDGENYFYKYPQSDLPENYFDDQFEWIDMFEAKNTLGSKIYWH